MSLSNPASAPGSNRASGDFDKIAPDALRYLTPPKDDGCPLLEVPEEVLVKVFAKLGRGDLTSCRRLCKSLHTLITETPSLALHHLLLSHSLRLNPNALLPVPNRPNLLPPSPAQLLETLQRRLDGFDKFQWRKKSTIHLKEAESRLYEYLEGILLRGTGGLRTLGGEMAVYDLRKLGDWEDEVVEEDEQPGVQGNAIVVEGQAEEEEVVDEEDLADTLRVTKKFGFDIAEFAVDPGQDLLVIVQIETRSPTQHDMYFHLKSLSTFEPHPRAPADPLKWPQELPRRSVQLGFQICDDGLFVLRHNQRIGSTDRLCGWQWTTGRLAVTLLAQPVTSFESFVMLTPTSFIVPIVHTRLDTASGRNGILNDPSDLSWTHHLCLFAFPPFSAFPIPTDPSEPVSPPHAATLVRTIDMPSFHVDLTRDIPPPRMNIRADPPPRAEFPTHPVENVQAFVPEPTSGTYTIEFACQTPDVPFPHYVMVMPKSTLLQHVPPKDSPLLRQARPKPMPVVSWDKFRHDVRLFGHEMIPSSWVCYIYQDRYITPIRRDRSNDDPDQDLDVEEAEALYKMDRLRLYDFDGLRVKRELLKRTHADPAYISPLLATAAPLRPIVTSPTVASPSSAAKISPASPSAASPPTSPSRTRSFIRRLSSTFKRARPNEPEVAVEPEATSGTVDAAHQYDGLRNGVMLVTAETFLPPNILLPEGTSTGANFPFTFVDKFDFDSETVLIDDERIVLVNADDEDEEWDRPRNKTVLEVLEF